MDTMKQMNEMIEAYGKENYKKGRELGYTQGIEDFYQLLITTKMTPSEIYEKLRIDKE